MTALKLSRDRSVPHVVSEPSTAPRLKLSRDRKVAPYIQNPSGVSPKPLANSFGLPAGTSCPGRTPFCDSCYAEGIEKRWSGPAKLVQHNWELLTADDDIDRMAALLLEAVDAYLAEHAKAEKRTGSTIAKLFRIHWDGDFYSEGYALAWRTVILARPEVEYWAYTRTFGPEQPEVVAHLHDLTNLRLLLSVDKWNEHHAPKVLADYPRVQVAVCDSSYEAAQATMVTLRSRKAPKCPENARVVPLVNAEGIGACASCRLCTPLGPKDRGDVLFSSTHK